ncbi:MAG: HAD hydrolase-like protein [Chitinivibrionales bacterium]|nr:HAD hydrolase-like protein [Chitinivibrionales bacterium]
MADPADKLRNFIPRNKYVVCIDSDGCVFDSMEIKHKECFCPQFINHYDLQPVSKYAREVWEFVNLYSVGRGLNRFKALIKALDLCADRREIKDRNISITRAQGVRDWIRHESRLGNPALKAEIEKNPDPDLKRALEWSLDVNEVVGKIVRNVPPFPLVRESLEKITQQADVIVVSQTPLANLEKEWNEHDLAGFVNIIAGQEMGTKKEHIDYVVRDKYESGKVIMLGDAPGDFHAAKANGVLYYPVNPGHEEASWKRFHDETLDKFFGGTYAGEYEEKCINEFNNYLPENPPWQ